MSPSDLDKLVTAAQDARAKAYAPYSRFHVGAAVLGASGRMYAAANVENASYGLTICAERNAITRAVFEGETKLVAVAVAADCDPVVTPCGACRQVLAEFAGEDLDVIMANRSGVQLQTTLGVLLPNAFTRANHLKETPR